MKSLVRNLWLGASMLTMAFAASAANADQSLSVSATAGATTPDWTPADGMAQSQTPLNASAVSPTPPSGCSLRGLEWGSWTIGPSSNPVQYSLDNSTWSEGTSGYSAWIVQPEPGNPAATLYVTYTVGGYWQFPCQIGAGQDDYPCGDTWILYFP